MGLRTSLLPLLLSCFSSDDESTEATAIAETAEEPTQEPPKLLILTAGEQPLTIEHLGQDYQVYSQNTLYNFFSSNCSLFMGDNMTMPTVAVDACMASLGEKSIEELGIAGLLRQLEEQTVYVKADEPAEYLKLAKALIEADPIELTATSTAPSTDQSQLRDEYREAHKDKEHPDFTDTYRQIYGAPLLNYPDHLDPLHIPVDPHFNTGEIFDVLKGSVEIPALRVVIDDGGSPDVRYQYIDDNNGVILAVDPDKILPIYSLVKHFSSDLDKAAAILHEHHPHIHEENLRMQLYSRMGSELNALDFEDPWQDRGAAAYSGADIDFKMPLKGKEVGVLKNGDVFDAPWRLGSELVVAMEHQGFGPMQVILGLAIEAASDPEVLAHYEGELSAEDFVDNKAALKTILENPVFVYALCYDYVLTKLERTVFKDPAVRRPRSSIPHLQDDQASREFALVHTASMLVAYPEKDVEAKNIVLSTGGLGMEYIWAKVFEIQPNYPSLRLFELAGPPMPDHGGQSLVDYVVTGDLGADEMSWNSDK
jgi:hypothetical protein